MWMPAVKELPAEAFATSSDSVRLTQPAQGGVGKTIIAWEAAGRITITNLMEKEEDMAGLADQYRTKMKKLAGDSDANVRARVALRWLGPRMKTCRCAAAGEGRSPAVRALALAGSQRGQRFDNRSCG